MYSFSSDESAFKMNRGESQQGESEQQQTSSIDDEVPEFLLLFVKFQLFITVR
jgi:hypothetical protein